jgi:hypothetical protein
MSKRPKSREETPKEGSDSARRYRTATICDRAAQSARVFTTFPMQFLQGLQSCNSSKTSKICNIFQCLAGQTAAERPKSRPMLKQSLDFVMLSLSENKPGNRR